MSTDPNTPEVVPPEDSTGEEDAAVSAARREKIVEHLVRTWGDPAPPCPYCRITSWQVDTGPVLLQRFGELPGFGVPVFLVWCSNCGHEVFLSVAATGLWEEIAGTPLEVPVGDEEASSGATEVEPDGTP